jgi:hypothetical protein
MNLNIFYRISDAGNPKEKISGKGKKECLGNALEIFGKDHFNIRADHCSEETLRMIRNFGLEPEISSLGNAGSWLKSARQALSPEYQNSALYFIEDDYIHLPDSTGAILDGLSIADYVSLYDHPDKYTSGINPLLEDSSEWSRISPGKFCHWKSSNSTTMTFALKQETLKADFPVWERHCAAGFPDDFRAFLELQSLDSWENRMFGRGRKLITSLPAFSTHTESAWLSPLRNWSEIS